MNAADRKAAIAAYKSRPIAHGICVIRCAATGQAWIAATTKPGIGKNGLWFQLQHGANHNKAMQAAWTEHGEQTFSYEIVETFDEALSLHEVEVAIAERLPHWTKTFNATPLI